MMQYALQLLTIAGVLFLGVASPGPNVAIVTSTALGASRHAGVLAGMGLATASFTWVVLTIAGLGFILSHTPWVYAAVKTAGAAYLIYLGAKMLLGARKPMAAGDRAGMRGSAAFRKAFVVSMTNPKSLAFYGSIFTVMVPPSAPLWFYVATAAITTLVSAGWYCSLALLFSHGAAQRIFSRAKTAIEATMGVVLIVMGGRLLLSR